MEECGYLVRLHWLQVAAVEVEGVVLFVQLHAFAVVLEFGKHSVRTFLERHRNALARLRLSKQQQ